MLICLFTDVTSCLCYVQIVTELRLIAQNVQEIASRESLTHLRVVTDMVRDATYDTIQTAFVTLKKSPKDKKALWVDQSILSIINVNVIS